MSWLDEPTQARQLAAWTGLGPDRFGRVYQRLDAAAAATQWAILALRPNPILEACQEAERLGFIAALAAEVAEAERMIGERDAEEINAMMIVFGDSAVTEAVIDASLGFPGIFMHEAIGQAMAASVLVTVDDVPAGSGFLVAPDLVLTAGHVVLDTTQNGGKAAFAGTLRSGVRFLFRSARDKTRYDQAVPPASSGKQPVAMALPFADPPNRLRRDLCQESARALDFALVRLARQVTDIPHLDILAPPAPRPEALWVVGFPGGTAISFPSAKVTVIDPAAARVFHEANTQAGMSGSCCLGPDGKPSALHEGSLVVLDKQGNPVIQGGRPQKINRAVALNSIRVRLASEQPDPLVQRAGVPGLAFRDRRTLERWRIEARRLAGASLAAWDQAVEAGLGLSPTDPDVPAFHPWFTRKGLETWVEQARTRPDERIRYVNGPPGAGKSFSARIVEEKLNDPARDLMLLDPTVITKWDWEDALDRLGATSQGEIFRTLPGALRHETIPDIVARLGLVAGAARQPEQPLFVAIDFERDTAGSSRLRFESTPWPPFILELARQPWARLLLIGLAAAERTDFDDMFFNDAQTASISPDDIDLAAVGGDDIAGFVRTAFAQQNQAVRRADMARILADWEARPFHNANPEMQTVEAVLFAMERTRELWAS